MEEESLFVDMLEGFAEALRASLALCAADKGLISVFATVAFRNELDVLSLRLQHVR